MSFSIDELKQSGYIHYPLPLHQENSLEAELLQAPVTKELPLEALQNPDSWELFGGSTLSPGTEILPSGKPGIGFYSKSPVSSRPNGRLEEGDCSNYGGFGIRTRIERENWEAYNRISFYLKADCEGIRHISLCLSFENDGEYKIPDIYNREGFHNMNLICGQWMHVSLEIGTLPRDAVTGLKFSANMCGCETDGGLGNILHYTLGDIRLQKTAEEEHTLGWLIPSGKVAYSFSGYLPALEKTAVAGFPAGTPFSLINEKDEVCLSDITKIPPPGYFSTQISLIVFSSVQEEGMYRIQIGDVKTELFPIAEDAYLPSLWKTINFLFCQRCGYPVPGSHVSCHRDMVARHNGKSFVCNGGWHDAGDVSQQLVQTAEITYSLLESSNAYKENTDLSLRLREEALWGMDYVLHSRFGDGFRATSVGISMWTDNIMGTEDDLTARCHNNAYENFLCSGVEAYASLALAKSDPLLSARLLDCAVQDFAFAKERFAQTGFSEYPPEYWEHTWMTSESLFAATISWAASQIYRCTKDKDYAETAAEFGEYLISCQEKGNLCVSSFPIRGFFYRSPEKKSLQHFNHQAREQYYMMALTELCYTQPEHPSVKAWSDAIALYGDYLKNLMAHGNPYQMLPAGLYRMEEADDKEAFARQHLETGEEAYYNYKKQLENAKHLGEGYYLKQFPVWFSFRGNNAILLSMGKAASLCGRFLEDKALIETAVHQLQWNLGKNPFRQSLMYGEGLRYQQQYANMPGEITGELPVGVQTLLNDDEPYWPQMNNATYKEVWTTPSARWLSICADVVS